jgi:succinate-semialdehyde dehydrogenase/glutarate-semialdehyde dehydrogenase
MQDRHVLLGDAVQALKRIRAVVLLAVIVEGRLKKTAATAVAIPVAAVYRCSSVDEMVARANDSEFGLNASVWTRDVKAGRAIAARIETGTVNVNEAYAATWASRADGRLKQSGLERRHGRHGILKMHRSADGVRPACSTSARRRSGHGRYATLMTQALRLLKHVPGIR